MISNTSSNVEIKILIEGSLITVLTNTYYFSRISDLHQQTEFAQLSHIQTLNM